MGALKGIIQDADGTPLINLYQEFGIPPKVITFELSKPGADIKKKCLDLIRHIEEHLQGEFMSGVHALVSSEFFDALTAHKTVRQAYERWQEGAALRSDMRAHFVFAGIVFEEYRGSAQDMQGSTRRFIEEGQGHCFPMGTLDTFTTYFAPADFNETVNTLGQVLYAKQEPRRFDRGTDLHTQSNPLPMCHRPALLVTLKAD
jgi:hypothetical protein